MNIRISNFILSFTYFLSKEAFTSFGWSLKLLTTLLRNLSIMRLSYLTRNYEVLKMAVYNFKVASWPVVRCPPYIRKKENNITKFIEKPPVLPPKCVFIFSNPRFIGPKNFILK